MKSQFWSGVLATVVAGAILAPLGALLAGYVEKRPDLEWISIARFTLPEAYQLSSEALPEPKSTDNERSFELYSSRVYGGLDQHVLAIENYGRATAKNVVLEVPNFPISVQLTARQRATRELTDDGRLVVTLDAVEPGEQALVFVSGGGVSLGDVRITFDGETVRERIGKHISLDFNEWRVSTLMIVTSLPLFLMGSFLFWNFLSVLAQTKSPVPPKASEETK